MHHLHTNRRYPTCYSEEPCKDDSVQYTATTESSTADGLSKLSLRKNEPSESGPNWEAQEVLFLDDSFCQSDCSKLTSEQGSSRFTDQDSSHCNGSDRSKSKSGHFVQDITYEDSFCQHYEKDTWWTDGLSDSDDESLKSKDDNYFIPIARRGRSMTIEATPQRGRSLDVSIQKKSHSFNRISRRSSDTLNMMVDQVSDKRLHKNNSGLHVKASSSHSHRRSSNGDSNHQHASHRRRLSADFSDDRRTHVKAKTISQSQLPKVHHSVPVTQREFHEDECKKRGPRQRSLEREHRRRSSSVQKYDRSSDKRATQRNFCNISSPEHESYEQCEKHHQRRRSITGQKNAHPLTARLLAERAIARQNPNSKLSHHSDERHRCPETNYKHHENQHRCSKGKQHNVHPLTARLSEGKNIGQQNQGNQTRRMETQQFYPEGPMKQSSLSKMQPSQSLKVYHPVERQQEASRPHIVRQSSCPESPSRRSKTLHSLLPQNAPTAESFQGSLQIEERRRRLQKQHSCPESPSRRPRASQQISHSQNQRPMERKQSGNDRKASFTGHGGPPGKNEDRYGPVSSYFTRRDLTPIRDFSDQLMIGETPDDSAFWHIEPDAFLSPPDPMISLKGEHKNGRGSGETRRFL